MPTVRLSQELTAIESLIAAGKQGDASARLDEASPKLGRRPEFRYLRCLYDATFRTRPEQELLRDLKELAGQQPDLVEATALLAELYARSGDGARATLLANVALESSSASARARASRVLTTVTPPQGKRSSQRPPPPGRGGSRRPSPPDAMITLPRDPPGVDDAPETPASAELARWFEEVRRTMVMRRAPTHGVRTHSSAIEMLIDLGKSVAEGKTALSSRPLELSRSSLEEIDAFIVAMRHAHTGARGPRSERGETTAMAAFFIAVVLHELEGKVVETSTDDGVCKVVVPSGAGIRPLQLASAFMEGTGPGLVHGYDRLCAARERTASQAQPGPLSRRPSSGQMPIPRTSSGSSGRFPAVRPSSMTMAAVVPVQLEELATTRPEVEAAPLRRLDRPTRPAEPPPLPVATMARAFAASAMGQDIALRSGQELAPGPSSIEALESYCAAIHGPNGAAPNQADWQPTDDEESTILHWGAFLGEAIIATYGGVWECDPNAPSDPRLFRVISQDKVAAWPVTLVYLRLKNGPRHDMMQFIGALGRLLG